MAVRERDQTNLGCGPDLAHVPFECAMIRFAAATAPAGASATVGTECLAALVGTRNRLDLSQAREIRLVVGVVTNGNAAGAAIKVSHMATEAATWSGTDSGASVVLGAGTVLMTRDSGWQSLFATARADNVTLALLVGVAFGSTAPTISTATVYFR